MLDFSRDLSGNCLNCTKVLSHVSNLNSLTWSCDDSQYRNDCTTGLHTLEGFIVTQTLFTLMLKFFTEYAKREMIVSVLAGVVYGVLFITIMASQFVSTITLVTYDNTFTFLPYSCIAARRHWEESLTQQFPSLINITLIDIRLHSDGSFSLNDKTNFSVTITAFSMRICWMLSFFLKGWLV